VASRGVRRFYIGTTGMRLRKKVEEDMSGGMETPSIGSVINRHDREWKVVHVIAAGLSKRNHSDRPRVLERPDKNQGTQR